MLLIFKTVCFHTHAWRMDFLLLPRFGLAVIGDPRLIVAQHFSPLWCHKCTAALMVSLPSRCLFDTLRLSCGHLVFHWMAQQKNSLSGKLRSTGDRQLTQPCWTSVSFLHNQSHKVASREVRMKKKKKLQNGYNMGGLNKFFSVMTPPLCMEEVVISSKAPWLLFFLI